jgi:UTP-glucose-1-phosphate uridylyltransferase
MFIDQGGDVFACEYTGDRFDTGRPIGLLKASIYAGLHDPAVAPELRAYLANLPTLSS